MGGIPVTRTRRTGKRPTIAALAQALALRECHVTAAGGMIRLRAGQRPPEGLLTALRERKPELLALIARSPKCVHCGGAILTPAVARRGRATFHGWCVDIAEGRRRDRA